MTLCIAVLAATVAAAAALRSVWSPCGLSMLSTITPLSEGARGNSYRVTARWFVVGATAGGATLGGLMAVAAVGMRALAPAPSALGFLALVAALVAAGSDAGVAGWRLPVHRRQVNERWLDQYRSWVYGAGFGWQIGTGLATYITTAAVYLMIVLGALTTQPVVALAIGSGFGFLRGLAVLLGRNLHTGAELRDFHRRFTGSGPMVGMVVNIVELGAVVVLTGVMGSVPALVLTGGATLATAVLIRGRRALTR